MVPAELQPPHTGITFFLIKLQPAQVVNIGAFTVHDLAEYPLPGHVQGIQFKEIIAAVFKHHAMPLCFLGCIHKFPAFLKRSCRGHFGSRMFALFHRVHRNRGMQQPGCAAVNQVHILHPAEIHPVVFPFGKTRRFFSSCIGNQFLSLENTFRNNIT